ncbi:DsbA family protein [Anoxybacillus kestanbolensis]|uniref:DsbA family protein n=1 Tax=Anoxybacillus kestanbolensis TaxID=227476 RepID=UPI003D1A3080
MKYANSGSKIGVILTIIILGLISALVVINNMNSEKANETITSKLPKIEGQPTLGKEDAPVNIVEFGDFKCPACKTWAESIFPQLVNDYVDTGKAKFSYINVLFHGEESKLASLAAESVLKNSPNEYWNFHKELFKEQPSRITPEKILEIGRKFANVDLERLETDIKQQTVIEELNNDLELVQELNVQQTPTILINDTIVNNPFDYGELKKLIPESVMN